MSIIGPGILFRYRAGGIVPGMTFTRSGTNATYLSNAGVLSTAGANVLRTSWFDTNADGVLDMPATWLEPAATNIMLWSRDCTNIAWTKSNVTPLLNITGVDGAANSASRLTATAGNGTCLQGVVAGAANYAFSCFIKRITGSGIINMTVDNGATWNVITVNNNWIRVTNAVQNLANPTVGWRIVTNGDAIAVDYAQLEANKRYTSPILTTSASATRNTDNLSATFLQRPQAMTFYVRYIAEHIDEGTDAYVLECGGANADPQVILAIAGGTGFPKIYHRNLAGSSVSATAGAAAIYGQIVEIRGVLQSDGSVFIGQSIAAAAESISAASGALAIDPAWQSQTITIGSVAGGTNPHAMGLINLLVLSGVRSMDSCRALV